MTSNQSRSFVRLELETSYENVVALCPKCTRRNVYNRASDIGHLRVIDNQGVVCQDDDCGAHFDIYGDFINAPYEILLLDSCTFLKEKRCMQAVLSATTAYELFFIHFLRVQLLYRPLRRHNDSDSDSDVDEWFNAIASSLHNETKFLTFYSMRNLFLRVAVDQELLETLAMAKEYIEFICNKDNIKAIKSLSMKDKIQAEIQCLSDEPRRSLLLRVCDTNIADLRNDVVHKTAYRPSLNETKAAVKDVFQTLFPLSEHFRLKNDDYHLNERLEHL